MEIELPTLKTSRKRICTELRNEGLSISEGYVNLHTLPMFKSKIAFA